MLLKALLKGLLPVALVCLVSNARALYVKADLEVTVQLQGLCISSSLGQQLNVLVKVTCQGNQFVSIEPRAGRPFVGTHGGAFRFAFSNAAPMPPAFLGGGTAVDDWVGSGTVTALRVLNLTERDERLEMLVSF